MDSTPTVYILHGEDEYAIANTIRDFEARLGDPVYASLNISRLDGITFQPDQLLSVAGAMPFLAKRRLVIVTGGMGKIKQEEAQKNFLADLEKLPPTTAVILAENHPLTDYKARRKNKIHWLEVWARAHPKLVYLKEFEFPQRDEWNKRVQEMANKAGGQISPAAAELLGSLVDGDPRLADQEVQKLVAYVNYKRPVETDDVASLTADVGQGDIFKLVDALGGRDGRLSLGMLRRLLEYQDAPSIFGMVVRQFRLLIRVREILDRGGGSQEVMGQVEGAQGRYLADQLIAQARRFSFADLVKIYHTLLDIDEAVKTSQMPGELALETLVASLVAG